MIPGALLVVNGLMGVHNSVISVLIAAVGLMFVDAILPFRIVYLVRLGLPAFELFKRGSRANGARVVAVIGAAIPRLVPVVLPYVLAPR